MLFHNQENGGGFILPVSLFYLFLQFSSVIIHVAGALILAHNISQFRKRVCDRDGVGIWTTDEENYWKPGPSCSKLTMSLVNDSLKFTLSDTQIC